MRLMRRRRLIARNESNSDRLTSLIHRAQNGAQVTSLSRFLTAC
jgi:hypothetical protein